MNAGWESWKWDETLFVGAAAHDAQGRTPYAAGLVDALTETLGLDGKGRMLDRTVDDVVANVLSTSATTPHLLGERLDAFETDLRSLLADVSPAGVFSVYLPDNILNLWRVAA